MNLSIQNIFQRLNKFFFKRTFIKQIGWFYISTWVLTILFLPLMYMTQNLFGEDNAGPDIKYWLLIITIVPVIETFLFQYGIFKICNRIQATKRNNGLIILISAFIFGLMHTYSIGYMIFGFSMGIVLAYVFYFYSHHPRKAFWTTSLIHALRNLTALLFTFLDT
ncbi:MAG: CPBP family intramembrane glutamic endopeptidase [Ferruginibacter sp.]